MKRAVLCVENPQSYIDTLNDYSIMIIDPDTVDTRKKYLLDYSDWSLLITPDGNETRNGGDYGSERVLWYTSGTTGDSKFCSFTQQQIDNLAQRIINTYDITENDRYVSVMPLWHAHGQGMYWATRQAGCQVDFTTVKSIRTLEQLQPTFVSAVPGVLKVVANLNLTELRFVRSASAPLSDQLFYDLKTKFNRPVVEAFGMTEALSHCFTNPLYGEQRIGTVGLPDGVEADIVDGQLYIQGPTVVHPGWYNTGDLAERDSYGYYRILGRHRDQINIKGIKLNPNSLENQLKLAIPELVDCVIFGSDRVKCLYVGDVDPDLIQNFLVSLGFYCRASLLEKVETVPISPSNKISRSWLDTKY